MIVLTVKLNAVQVLAIASLGLAAGIWIKRKVPVLDRLNIPASILGGLALSVLALVLRDRWLNLDMDLVLRDILMVAFFTTVGMSASLRLVRDGGLQVLWFYGISTIGAALQNGLGIAVALLLGVSPLLGIVSGSVALTGGPATALAFGPTFEAMGVTGASTLGLASATFGILCGGLLGGGIGGWLIERNKLHGERHRMHVTVTASVVASDGPPLEPESDDTALMRTVLAIAVAMGIGTIISSGFERTGAVLPAYIGAMIAAAVIRNADDRFRFARLSQDEIDRVGDVSLNVFIVMALLTLRLWELANLAAPLVVMLIAQVALVWAMCVFLAYRLMGRDYQAAVMAGGFCGFMLGTTANALACMGVLTEKYGPAPRAYIVVPVVGAFLIDFTNALLVTGMANIFR